MKTTKQIADMCGVTTNTINNLFRTTHINKVIDNGNSCFLDEDAEIIINKLISLGKVEFLILESKMNHDVS